MALTERSAENRLEHQYNKVMRYHMW